MASALEWVRVVAWICDGVRGEVSAEGVPQRGGEAAAPWLVLAQARPLAQALEVAAV